MWSRVIMSNATADAAIIRPPRMSECDTAAAAGNTQEGVEDKEEDNDGDDDDASENFGYTPLCLALRENLVCFVCLAVPAGRVEQCPNGHLLCADSVADSCLVKAEGCLLAALPFSASLAPDI